MGWKVFGWGYSTSELTDKSVFQPIKFNKNILLRAIRTWIIVYNDPDFTSLNLKLYSDNTDEGSHEPIKLLATSESKTKADIITLENGVREVAFIFDDYPINKDTYYNLVLNGAGYTGSSNECLAWRKGFPDPVYSSGYTPAIETVNKSPYEVYAIGAEF